jgi:hypothetical protein
MIPSQYQAFWYKFVTKKHLTSIGISIHLVSLLLRPRPEENLRPAFKGARSARKFQRGQGVRGSRGRKFNFSIFPWNPGILGPCFPSGQPMTRAENHPCPNLKEKAGIP